MRLRIDEVLQEVQGPDVLDVGCAGHQPDPESPYWLHGKLRKRFNVVGVDASAHNISWLQSRGFDNLIVGDAQELDLAQRFDTIVAGELIEHLGRPECFLRTLAGHLKPGGRIVITTPYPFSLLNFLYALKNFPRTCSNPEHTMWFCPSTLSELARRAGLRVQRWRLIMDLEPGQGSVAYRLFVAVMATLGILVPRRLRCNAVLFVLAPESRRNSEER